MYGYICHLFKCRGSLVPRVFHKVGAEVQPIIHALCIFNLHSDALDSKLDFGENVWGGGEIFGGGVTTISQS